jgi:hypothetical protein
LPKLDTIEVGKNDPQEGRHVYGKKDTNNPGSASISREDACAPGHEFSQKSQSFQAVALVQLSDHSGDNCASPGQLYRPGLAKKCKNFFQSCSYTGTGTFI